MKKAVGLLTGLLIIFSALQAQRKPARIFVELNLGPSIPLGQFAETSYNGPVEEEQPGMAAIGLGANVTAGYYLKENFGLLLTAGYSTNKQKEDGYREFMEKNPAAYPSYVDVETNKWKVYKVMAGGFFITPLVDDKLNLVTKLSAGICKTAIPSYSWAVNGTGALGGMALSMGWVGKEKLPTMFCYQVGLGLQYKLNQRIHVLFDVNSFNAATKKDYSVWSTMPFPGSSLTTISRKYKFGSVNTLLGLGLSF
jgi:opacity protein-like surface antigen